MSQYVAVCRSKKKCLKIVCIYKKFCIFANVKGRTFKEIILKGF